MTPETDSYSPSDIARLNDFIHLLSFLDQNYDINTIKTILRPVLDEMGCYSSIKTFLEASSTTVKLSNLSIKEREIWFRETNLELRSEVLSLKEEVLSLKEERFKLKTQLQEINTEKKS